MTHAPQTKVAATYMRGGTSKGVFFRQQDLPESAQQPGVARDKLLLRELEAPILMANRSTVWVVLRRVPVSQ